MMRESSTNLPLTAAGQDCMCGARQSLGNSHYENIWNTSHRDGVPFANQRNGGRLTG
jgi:hypothetical protein